MTLIFDFPDVNQMACSCSLCGTQRACIWARYKAQLTFLLFAHLLQMAYSLIQGGVIVLIM